MHSLARALLRSSIFGVAMAASRVALACPACQSGRSLEFLKLGAILSLVPFGVVAMVIWVLRHEPRT